MKAVPSSRLVASLTFVAGLLSAEVAQAQYFPIPFGRGGPYRAMDFGLGMMQQMHRQQRAEQARRQRAIAIQQEQHRRAALSRTKSGRAQLARERNAQRQRAQQQDRFIRALATGLFSGGGGGSSSGSYRSDPAKQFHDDQLLRRQHGLD